MNVDNVGIIISEIDGVITDGCFTEDEIGNVLYKTFNYKDFDAINEIKRLGYTFVFMSDDNRINYNMCKRRNIPFYWATNADKKFNELGNILRRYGFTPDQAIYVPSKLTDVRCVHTVPRTICPADTIGIVRKACMSEFVKNGGEGIISNLLDLLTGNIIIEEISD